ncbi:MAG: putative DNA-binding domain-containing protein [Myxococcaceae bacterium]|nr:putative DNA-binding domain-containing protein [Myxococcaceae bacterium]
MWPFSRKKPALPPEPEAPPAPPPETGLQRLQREVFERVIEGKPSGPAGIDDWRLQVYGGMYEARTHDALIEDVPHTAKLLGERFPAIVKAYVAEVPSTHYSLARLGHGFSAWLRSHPVPDARPDLPDLAALEWARSEAFVADDCAPIYSEEIQQLGPERFTKCWMQLVPSVRVLDLGHRVTALWAALEAGEPVTPALSPTAERELVVVWRKGFDVFHVAIAADEHAALLSLRNRDTVEAICEHFAGRGDDAAHAAFQAIGSWINEGMIGAIREPAVAEAGPL